MADKISPEALQLADQALTAAFSMLYNNAAVPPGADTTANAVALAKVIVAAVDATSGKDS